MSVAVDVLAWFLLGEIVALACVLWLDREINKGRHRDE